MLWEDEFSQHGLLPSHSRQLQFPQSQWWVSKPLLAPSEITKWGSLFLFSGSPSEYYVYGSTFAWAYAADAISCIVAAVIFIPIYYNLGVTSVYEYLELRFGRMIRVCMTGKFEFIILTKVTWNFSNITCSKRSLQWSCCIFSSSRNESSRRTWYQLCNLDCWLCLYILHFYR